MIVPDYQEPLFGSPLLETAALLPVGKLAKFGVRGLSHVVDDLSKAAGIIDRNGLTKAGRALQKHGNRLGSAFPKIKGGPKALNPAGQNIVDDILTAPGAITKKNRYGGMDIVAPDGRGVRYDAAGEFVGFLEP